MGGPGRRGGFGLDSELTLDGIDATPTVANRFHYAGNDPINASDPLGLFVVTDKGLVLSGYCEGAELFGADIGCAAAAMAQPIADFHAGVLHTLVSSVTFGVADSRSVLGLFNAEDKVDYSSRYFMAGQLIAAVVEIGTGAAGAIKAVSAARNAIRARSLARAGNALDDDAARHIDNIADEGRVAPRRAFECPANSFSADTEVVLADGSRVAISSIGIGDLVLGSRPTDGSIGPARVAGTWPHGDFLTDLVLKSGGTIRTTEDHEYWSASRSMWLEAQDLSSSDRLLSITGSEVGVVGLDASTTTWGVAFDLTVENLHSYFVVASSGETVLVHNCGEVFTDWREAEEYARRVTGGRAVNLDAGNGYGLRQVDNLYTRPDGVLEAQEIKIGYVGLDSDTSREMLKDAELLASGQVDAVSWVFFRSGASDSIGPSGPLRTELESFGIQVFVRE